MNQKDVNYRNLIESLELKAKTKEGAGISKTKKDKERAEENKVKEK